LKRVEHELKHYLFYKNSFKRIIKWFSSHKIEIEFKRNLTANVLYIESGYFILDNDDYPIIFYNLRILIKISNSIQEEMKISQAQKY
jgi:hypothetical protein